MQIQTLAHKFYILSCQISIITRQKLLLKNKTLIYFYFLF